MVTLTLGSSLAAQDWPQWRGPSRDGTVAAAGTPKWPGTWRRAWRVDVGGSRQIVTMTHASIEGLDAKTSAALWSAVPALLPDSLIIRDASGVMRLTS